MKYTPQGQFKQTSCKECVFAIYSGNTQTECMADRISKFKPYVVEAYDDEKEFFVIDKICNLFRPSGWNNGIVDVQKAKNESSITFDVLINCDKITEQYVENIKRELKNISYPDKKIKIYLFQSSQSNKYEKQVAFQLYQELKDCVISIYFDKAEYIYGILQKSNSTFHIIIDENNINGISELLLKVNSAIVDDLKRFILCKSVNKLFISNMAIKILYQNLYFDYDNVMSSFLENAKKENLYTEF